MRLTHHRLWLPALAFFALACAPCRRHPGPGHGPGMGCGPEACVYKSQCFSDGASRSNDGVCQTCSGGKWAASTGCHECAGHTCGMMDKSAPCDAEHHHHPPKH